MTYSLKISATTAKKLLSANNKDLQLPKIGYELSLASAPARTALGIASTLMLQNISGVYVLFCCSWPVKHWHYIFTKFNFLEYLPNQEFPVNSLNEFKRYLVYDVNTLEVLARYVYPQGAEVHCNGNPNLDFVKSDNLGQLNLKYIGH